MRGEGDAGDADASGGTPIVTVAPVREAGPMTDPDQTGRDDGSLASLHSHGSIASFASTGSIASFASAGSIASFGSAGSLGGFGSAGSIGSVLSLWSVGSIASIASVGKIACVGNVPIREVVAALRRRVRRRRLGRTIRGHLPR